MERRDIRNFALNVSGEALWGFQAAMVAPATVLAVLLRDLGAGEGMIGSILAVESGAILLPQILGNYLFASRARRKRRLMAFHFVVILPLLGVMAGLTHLTFLPHELLRWLLLVSFGCYVCSIGVVLSAWWDWFAHLFGRNVRGTVMGVTWCAAAGAGACGALLAGGTIGAMPGFDGYFYLYLGALVLAVLSIVAFCFVDDSPAQAAADGPAMNTARLIGHFKESLRDRNFRAFLIGRILGAFGFCILPLVVIYYMSAQGGGLPKQDVVSYGSALALGSAVANLVLGRLGDKMGYRIGLLLGAAAQFITLGLMLLTAGPVSCAAAYFGAGLCGGAAFVSHQNMLFETCPHEDRMAHITVGNLVMSAAFVTAPLLAGQAAGIWGVRKVFAACLVFSAAAFLWYLLRLREPRDDARLTVKARRLQERG